MKKSFITLSITFLAYFTAFGQSVLITPSVNEQVMVHYGTSFPVIFGAKASGSSTTPSATTATSTLFFLGGGGHTGTGFTSTNASIRFNAAQTFSLTALGANITFETTAINTTNRLERMRISDVGNLGIGTTTPNGKLQFKNENFNRKIVLYEDANNDHQFLGFGVNSETLRYQIPSSTNSHVFFAGTSPTASTELMRITGEGRVGIGVVTPNAKLEVNGFTKLGSDAPAIKVKKITGTTAASGGTSVSVAHGLTRSKIISATALVDDGSFSNFPNSPIPGVNFSFEIDNTHVFVHNSSSSSTLSYQNLLSL